QCDIYVYMTIYKVQYIPLIARRETPGKTWLPYPRAGEMTTVVVAATRSDIKGARESRAAQVWGCVTFTPPGFVSVSNPSRVPRLSASDARNPNKATVRPPRRQRRIARPVSRYSHAITMPNPRRITARHKSQFDSRATGNSDRITRLVHAHCLLFECNENMAETVEVALSRCGRRKQPNPRRKNARYRTASVAKFHCRSRHRFANEIRLRITSAAGADAGSGMMQRRLALTPLAS
ncbi:hypothetical protein LSAT2_002492, partial [Lamellibrachia satsuma]